MAHFHQHHHHILGIRVQDSLFPQRIPVAQRRLIPMVAIGDVQLGIGKPPLYGRYDSRIGDCPQAMGKPRLVGQLAHRLLPLSQSQYVQRFLFPAVVHI